MRIDFDRIGNSGGKYPPLPNGKYRVRIDDVETTKTRKGADMWKLRLVVTEGDHEGRRIYDNLVFSKAAAGRLVGFCGALNMATSGEIELTPDMLPNKECIAAVHTEEYTDREGNVRERSAVLYRGYFPVVDGSQSDDDDDLPF